MNLMRYYGGKMDIIILILAVIIFTSLGQVFWKIGMNSIGVIDNFSISGITSTFLNPLIVLGLIMYGLSMVCWLIALSKKDLSYIYPFISLTFVAVLFLSFFILKETVSIAKIVGTIIIVIGLMVVVRG